jgi:hypothetical protein
MAQSLSFKEYISTQITGVTETKTDVNEHIEVPMHVGLLCNQPPDTAGLPFIESSDELTPSVYQTEPRTQDNCGAGSRSPACRTLAQNLLSHRRLFRLFPFREAESQRPMSVQLDLRRVFGVAGWVMTL